MRLEALSTNSMRTVAVPSLGEALARWDFENATDDERAASVQAIREALDNMRREIPEYRQARQSVFFAASTTCLSLS